MSLQKSLAQKAFVNYWMPYWLNGCSKMSDIVQKQQILKKLKNFSDCSIKNTLQSPLLYSKQFELIMIDQFQTEDIKNKIQNSKTISIQMKQQLISQIDLVKYYVLQPVYFNQSWIKTKLQHKYKNKPRLKDQDETIKQKQEQLTSKNQSNQNNLAQTKQNIKTELTLPLPNQWDKFFSIQEQEYHLLFQFA